MLETITALGVIYLGIAAIAIVGIIIRKVWRDKRRLR